MRISRGRIVAVFLAAIAWAQFRESGAPELAGHLELAMEPRLPARVYLFKDGRPFRLSPVDAILPLRVDSYYRERLWQASPRTAETLEVTCNDQSHFFLLRGVGRFDLPAGRYRVEAYRGLFYTPATMEFELRAGESRRVALELKDWTEGQGKQWISGDDHIHLTRSKDDDETFLSWLEAEDLSVGNFLQLQRHMDASVQYAFGLGGEARRGDYTIRPGQESRSEFFGHVNLLGGSRMLRPLSVGTMYANSPLTYPYPAVLFRLGRDLKATMGYAHFQGSMPHSTQLMDLALGTIDFIEVMQFGVLKTEPWYELLNAGIRITGIAGSDFPVGLNRAKVWPRYIPLLGPERTLVRKKDEGGYSAWAAGVRDGSAMVTNGPLVDLAFQQGEIAITARFFRPLERLELIANGKVVASGKGNRLTAPIPRDPQIFWIAARAVAQKEDGEPEIQAHTNPVYLARGRGSFDRAVREELAKKWEAEIEYYKTAPLVFRDDTERQRFFRDADRALAGLLNPP